MGVPLKLVAMDDLSDILADFCHSGYRFLISFKNWKICSNCYWQSFICSRAVFSTYLAGVKGEVDVDVFSERAVRLRFPCTKSRE